MSNWDRLAERLPEEFARKLADRLENLERTSGSARMEIEISVARGHLVDLRWQPDERIPLTKPAARA